jgi:hypothetical protein
MGVADFDSGAKKIVGYSVKRTVKHYKNSSAQYSWAF